jgi:hypothetical protein
VPARMALGNLGVCVITTFPLQVAGAQGYFFRKVEPFLVNFGPRNCILKILLGCVINHPPVLLWHLDLKASSTALFAKNIVDAPPEGSVLFSFHKSQDLLLCFLVVLLLGSSKTLLKMLLSKQLPVLPEVLTPLDSYCQAYLNLPMGYRHSIFFPPTPSGLLRFPLFFILPAWYFSRDRYTWVCKAASGENEILPDLICQHFHSA